MESILALIVGIGLGIIGILFSTKDKSKPNSEVEKEVFTTNNTILENKQKLEQLEIKRQETQTSSTPKTTEELLDFLNKDGEI